MEEEKRGEREREFNSFECTRHAN
jgi:hypothetical protein